MLKLLATVLPVVLVTQFALPSVAAPRRNQGSAAKEVYIGVFSFDESDVRDVYVIPGSIKRRGDLRRFQIHDVYREDQHTALGNHKYRQTIDYWVANCREGTSDVQKANYFDAQGNKVSELLMELKLRVPSPGSVNEKALDFVCDYKP